MAKGVGRQFPSGKAICCWVWSRGWRFLWNSGLAGLWEVMGAGGTVPASHPEPNNPSVSFPSAEYCTKAKIPTICITSALHGAWESVLALFFFFACYSYTFIMGIP